MSSLAMKGAGIIHGAPGSAAIPGASPKRGGYGSNNMSPRRYPDNMDYESMRERGVANAPGLPSVAAAAKNGL
jgi:hypothetical protein